MKPTTALTRLYARLTRRSGLAWTSLLAVNAAVVVLGYEAAYPRAEQRELFAAQIGANLGFQALYGRAFDLLTAGGFTAWRFGGLVSVIVMIWGASSAIRLTRTEEQTGRGDLVGAGALTRRGWYGTAMAVAAGWQVLAGVFLWITLVAVGLVVGGSAVLAIEISCSGLTGVGFGLLAAQIWPTRARALGRSSLAIGALFILRVIADGTTGLGWLRWGTPFGWGEESRPFTNGQRLWPLVLLAGLAGITAAVGAVLVLRRDVGGAFRTDHDHGPATTNWLRTLATLEVRVSAGSALGWAASLAAVGVVTGMLASSVGAFARDSPGYEQVMAKLGVGDLGRPAAFVGLMFSVLAVAVAVYAARAAVAGADSESEGLLDNLAAQPLTRRRWLLTHSAVTTGYLVLVSVAAGLGSWVGVVAQGDSIAFSDALGAGLNLVPLAVLVLGIGALVHGAWPRAVGPVTLTVVVVGYLIELIGSMLQAPTWLRDLSPFHHLSPFPAAPLRPEALLVLSALGIGAAVVGAELINRRDVLAR